MKRPTRVFVTAALSLLAASEAAHASGSFLCEIKDEALTFSAESTFSHGLGGQFLDFATVGTVALKDAPKDLTALKFDKAALVHHWFSDGNLKLHLYSERTGEAPHGYVELMVETKQSPDDETTFDGTYRLNIYDTTDVKDGEGRKLDAEGKATCSVG